MAKEIGNKKNWKEKHRKESWKEKLERVSWKDKIKAGIKINNNRNKNFISIFIQT